MWRFSVPTISPWIVRLSNLRLDEVKVQWHPIRQHPSIGRLLGYRVYYREIYHYRRSSVKIVNTSGPDVHMVILRGLKAAQSYRISVAAFTSKGAGPESKYKYITTGKYFFVMNRESMN